MRFLHHVTILAAALFIHAAWAQQSPPAEPSKTTEQQARSYILSAFMTGAAPAVVNDGAKVAPALRLRLALPPEADSRAVYYALVKMTAGKSLTVRPAKIDELEITDTQVEAAKPVFALDVSDSTFVLQYDLDKDSVTTLADATRPVAVTSPITAPEPPKPLESAAAEAPKPATEPAVVAPAVGVPAATSSDPAVAAEPARPATETATTPPAEPAAAAAPAGTAVAAPAAAAAAAPEPAKTAGPEAAAGARVQVVEPREPRLGTPTPAKAPATPKPIQVTREQPRLPPLKPNGACVIKPVMSDQDLVNCGASPR